jgi:hypothetical protein
MSRFDFACATHGPGIALRLLEDETSPSVFAPDKSPVFAQALRALTEDPDLVERLRAQAPAPDDMERYTRPLFTAFAHLADPTAARKSAPWKYLAWCCRAYLGQPVLTEDIYKIRDDLRDFDRFSARLPEDKRSIDAVSGRRELARMLRSMQEARDARRAEETRRRLGEEERERILDETSVVYEGPEGKIVIPHTEYACNYWGGQTRWCISARENNAFSSYHGKAAIFIFLPKPSDKEREVLSDYTSFKFAGTGRVLYDEHDNSRPRQPHCLMRLIGVAERKMSGAGRRHMREVAGLAQAAPMLPASGEWTNRKQFLRAMSHNRNNLHFASAKLKADKKTLIACLKINSDFVKHIPAAYLGEEKFARKVLKVMRTQVEDSILALMPATKKMIALEPKLFARASEQLRADKRVALGAVKADGALLEHAAPALREDRDVVLAAVRRSYFSAFRHAAPGLRKDEDVMLACLHSADRTDVEKIIPEELRADAAFMLKAVRKNVTAMLFADPAIWKEKPVILESLRTGHEDIFKAIQSHAPEMLDDRDVGLTAATRNYEWFGQLSPRLRQDREFMLDCAAQGPGFLATFGAEMSADKRFMLEAVRRNWRNLAHAARALKADMEVAVAGVSQSWEALGFVSRALRENRDVIKIGLRQSPRALEYASGMLVHDGSLARYATLQVAWRKAMVVPRAIGRKLHLTAEPKPE